MFFDISTKYKALNVLDKAIHYEDREDLTYFYLTKANKTKNYIDMNVTIFDYKGNETYQRYDDYNRQYYFDTDCIIDKLKKLGFKLEIFDGDKLTNYKANSSRLLVIAYKG